MYHNVAVCSYWWQHTLRCLGLKEHHHHFEDVAVPYGNSSLWKNRGLLWSWGIWALHTMEMQPATKGTFRKLSKQIPIFKAQSIALLLRSYGGLKYTGVIFLTITQLLLPREKTEMIRSYIQEVVQYIKRVREAICLFFILGFEISAFIF